VSESLGPDGTLSRIAKLARSTASIAVDDARKQESRAALLARADAAAAKRPVWVWSALPLVAPLAAAAAAIVWLSWPRALHYEVNGERVENGYVSAQRERNATLRFSDDTEVTAEAGARLRIEETTARGARVLVERGRARVNVAHRKNAEWTFVAGPFEVEVRGTRFVMSWEPAHEAFELELQQGAVNVRGPFGPGPIALAAGQRFRGDAAARSMSVTDARAEASKGAPLAPLQAGAASAQVLLAAPSPDSRPSAAPAPHGARSLPARAVRSWPQLIVDGEFKTIVSEAEARGITQSLSASSSADLRALSDAARYAGRADLAEQSLLSLRKRFPAAADGRAAAFMLGRLQEGRGRSSQAKTWYETYLAESPSGSFAAEALAGKMRTVLSVSGRAAARPIARDYLSRYPTGVHAKTARDIVGMN
jgi:TolA-binding protein